MSRYLIDTNIFCASILTPTGICSRFLELSQFQSYEPILTEVVLAEFINKCRAGLTKRNIIFSDAELDHYLSYLQRMTLCSPPTISAQ